MSMSLAGSLPIVIFDGQVVPEVHSCQDGAVVLHDVA